MKKTLCMILVLMLLMSIVPAWTAADPETDSEPVLTIHARNALFRESICPMFAVKSENADTIKLLIWRSEQEEYLLGSEATVLSSQGRQTVLGADCDVFIYAGFGAKEIADNVYARAYTEKNGIAYYSEVVRYSLLDYAYYLMGKTGPASSDSKLIALLDAMLVYGAAAQTYKNYHTDRLATDTYYQIKVVNGTLSNGFPDELYKPGTSVTIMAQATDANGNAFNHWENKAGVSVGRSATMNVIVGNANEVYTAKYGVNTAERLEPSAGLEIEDGVVLSIGECTDDFVVLPDEHDGTVVTEIDASAFAGEEFTSIFIPVSITTIGRRAFNNSSVTDVYYEGTAEQWGQISIGANNAALTGANIHFSSYGPTPVAGHTVTFKDYDGTVLSEQTVNIGEDAVAPAEPTRAGYTFAKWAGNYKNVTSDREITAVYYEGTGNGFIIGDAYTTVGGTRIAVPIYMNVINGIASFEIDITFEGKLEYAEMTKDPAFSTMPSPRVREIGNNRSMTLTWSNGGTTNVTGNYTLATLYFNNASLASGASSITLTYDAGSTANTADQNVPFSIVNGSVYCN